ncbi:hypothetical protein LSUE1_G009455, partial [Lachnellula suecica]
MPTYLVHGFRWQRALIRIHIILNDLEDAAPEWIMAPATSGTLLNSFYSLYDFLPPSEPPTAPLPLPPLRLPPPPPLPPPDMYEQENRPGTAGTTRTTGTTGTGRRTLSKKNTASMSSLRSLVRRQRPEKLEEVPPMPPLPNGYGNWNGHLNGHMNGHGLQVSNKSAGASIRSGSTKSMHKLEEKRPTFNDWSAVKLLEQYDPNDLEAVSQPYAYVGDYMVEVSLGLSLSDEMAAYEARLKAEEGPTTPARPRTAGEGMS